MVEKGNAVLRDCSKILGNTISTQRWDTENLSGQLNIKININEMTIKTSFFSKSSKQVAVAKL